MEKQVKLGDLDFYQKFYFRKEVYYVCPNQSRLKETWVIKRQGGSKQLLPNKTIVTIKDSSKYVNDITAINYLK